MQITDPFNNPRLFIEQTRTETLSQLRPGQVVTAQVIKPATNGMAQIDIGGIKLPVQTGVKLDIGEQLAINVVKGGKTPELQIIRNLAPDAIQALALKRILPQQLPIQQLLDGLKALSTANLATSPGGAAVGKNSTIELLLSQLMQSASTATQQPATQHRPASPLEQNLQNLTALLQNAAKYSTPLIDNKGVSQLAQQITQLVSQGISGKQPITAEVIRQAFEHSGLFLESRLAGQLPISNDFKASLLKLITELQPLTVSYLTPTDPGGLKTQDTATTLQLLASRIFAELRHLSEGSLARVQLHQLASLPQDENNLRQIWQFELPIPHPEGRDDFLLRFEKETSQSDPLEERWSVKLNFDIPPVGPICAKLNLQGDVISSHFTAEETEAIRRIEASLPKLSEAFIKAGLTVGRLSARQGEAKKQPDLPPSPFPLLDEKA